MELQIHNASGASSIVVGKNSAVADNNLQLRYGGGASSYSGSDALDLINYGDGNFNSVLTGTSDFNWIRGTNNVLMTLTDSGNLGIGITNPTDRLVVAGNAKITGVTTFTGNVTMSNLTVPILNINDISANLIGDINSTGVSTFRTMNIKGGTFSGIGIGTTANGDFLHVGDPSDLGQRIFIGRDKDGIDDSYGGMGVGIKTSFLSKISDSSPGGTYNCLEVYGSTHFHSGGFRVGGGSHTTPIEYRAAVDFSDVVSMVQNGTSLASRGYMIFPRVNTTQRNALGDGTTGSTTLRSGSVVYNTSVNRLELWTGGGWCGIATVV